MGTVKEQVARLLLNPHTLRTLKGHHALRTAISTRHVLEEKTAYLRDILGSERAGRSAVNYTTVNRLQEVDEAHHIVGLLDFFLLGTTCHAHA